MTVKEWCISLSFTKANLGILHLLEAYQKMVLQNVIPQQLTLKVLILQNDSIQSLLVFLANPLKLL